MEQRVVKVIKANPFINKKITNDFDGKLKVAAYARVSTDSDEQEDSFERQVEYYTKFIQSNLDWKFVKVYSDPGISGTRAEKRPGFQEMIQDARDGKINKILVKSIARFARNTVDALKYIRELKELGVGIYFESQNIDTMSPGGDILITILAATAEEESRTISKNIKWSYQKKFQKGDFVLNTNFFLGYKWNEDHKLVIVEEEAKIIRRIFREFLAGYTISQIANGLNEAGYRTKKSQKLYSYSTILRTLRNEKYYGCALMGKTYKPDVLSSKRYKNEGQSELYMVENAFEGIISKEMFEMAQVELQKRYSDKSSKKNQINKYSSKYTFSRMLRCGCCGGLYVRCNNMRNGENKLASWWCDNQRNKKSCSQKGISEKVIEDAFVKILNKLIDNFSDIKAVLESSIRSVINYDSTDKVNDLNKKIEELQNQIMELHLQKTNGKITEAEYAKAGGKLASMIDEYGKQKQELEDTYSKVYSTSERVKEIVNTIEFLNPTEKFEPEVFKRLIESVTITERTHLKFKFKVGIERDIDVNIK